MHKHPHHSHIHLRGTISEDCPRIHQHHSHGEQRHLSPHLHHHSHARLGQHAFPDKLYVVSVVSNPYRYQSRLELAKAYQKYVADSGAILLTVEVAHGMREFELTEADNPWHLRLRSNDHQVLWVKENAINLGIQRLCHLVPDWKHVAWIDADVFFSRPDWAQETLHALATYEVVQPFQHAYHYDREDRIIETHKSFCYCHSHGVPESRPGEYGKPCGAFWHPGFAWAARRSFFDKVGGLFDMSALGAGDHLMAKALVGRVDEALRGDVSEGLRRQARIWQERAKAVRRNIGALENCSVHHRYHGSLVNRAYRERWSYLTDGCENGHGSHVAHDAHKFNPETDLIRDSQGLWQIHPDKIKLRDSFREYFSNRKEDY